jgi:hypothetical protein
VSSSQSEFASYSFGHDQAILLSNLSAIHPSLGNLVQYFTRNDEDYEHLLDGRIYWESTFQLLIPDGTATMNARDLPRPEKDKIWDEVFRLKKLFFQEKKPDVVIHRVKHGIPLEKRIERYREQLILPDYDIFTHSRIISLERK